MRRILTACSATALLAVVATATPANAHATPGASVSHERAQGLTHNFSARRHYRHHRYYRRYGYYGGYYDPYYAYAYEPGPYYYGRPYYYGPPFPFSLWPFW